MSAWSWCRASIAITIEAMGGTGTRDSPRFNRGSAIVPGFALAASLGVLAWLLFMSDEKMPITVLISGLIAIGAAV
jgi:hypothetical protein